MKALILPIPPKIVDRITSGKQRYVFRRSKPRQPFTRIICCTDDPVPTTLLEIYAGEVEEFNPREQSTRYARFSGMYRPEWLAYWFEKEKGFAIEIISAVLIPDAKRFNPVHYWRLNQYPQNFCYVPMPHWPLGHPITRPGEAADALTLTS